MKQSYTICVNGEPIEFNQGEFEYYYYTEDFSIPTVTVTDAATGDAIDAEIIQAETIPDCALVTIGGATYRVRFIPPYSWQSIDENGNEVTITRPEDELKTLYDGDKLGVPERPYYHDYSMTLTMKPFLAKPVLSGKDGKPILGQSSVALRFDDVLNIVKEMDALTLGVPKIIYLVGWQRDGHDSGYPEWLPVNEALAFRENSNGATADLNFLMKEAREKYHTIVSLHINSSDAYGDSPLWDLYVKNDLILMKVEGQQYNGMDNYTLDYKKYWEGGFYIDLINRLLEALPELKYAKTIHSDAFLCHNTSKSTFDEQLEARRQMIRYWHDIGFDLTSEFAYGAAEQDDYTHRADNIFSPDDPIYANPNNLLTGLMPYAYHLAQSDAYFQSRPASLLTGGTDLRSFWGEEKGDTTKFQRFAYGASLIGEDTFPRISDGEFIKQFCTLTVPYLYQNQFPNESLTGEGNDRRVVKSDPANPDAPLVAQFAQYVSDRTLKKGDILLRQGDDLFIPAAWLEKSVIVYSATGYADRTWTFLPEWDDVTRVSVSRMTTAGLELREEVDLIDSDLGKTITLSLKPREALVISPIGEGR